MVSTCTYQFTNIAALFSVMNGSSPQTLQKPNSNIHHHCIFMPWRFPSTSKPSRRSDQSAFAQLCQHRTRLLASTPRREGDPGARFIKDMMLVVALPRPSKLSSSPSQPPSASVICAPACNHHWSRSVLVFELRQARMDVPNQDWPGLTE